MPRRLLVIALLLLARPALADAFDHYTNPALARLLEGKNVKEVKQLTPVAIVEHDRKLTATEIKQRVHDHYHCQPEEPLTQNAA